SRSLSSSKGFLRPIIRRFSKSALGRLALIIMARGQRRKPLAPCHCSLSSEPTTYDQSAMLKTGRNQLETAPCLSRPLTPLQNQLPIPRSDLSFRRDDARYAALCSFVTPASIDYGRLYYIEGSSSTEEHHSSKKS